MEDPSFPSGKGSPWKEQHQILIDISLILMGLSMRSLSLGQAFIGEFCHAVLRQLTESESEKEASREGPQEWDWELHNNNVKPHAPFIVQQFWGKKEHGNCQDRSPLSPVLTWLEPYNLFLFYKMKIKLRGQRFDMIEESQPKSQAILNTFTRKDFQHAFHLWK